MDRKAWIIATLAIGLTVLWGGPAKAQWGYGWGAWGGYGGLALAAIALGLAASALAQAVTPRPIPLFVDGWDVLPVAVGPQFLPLGLAALGALLVVGAAGAAAATLLVRATTEESA